MPPPIKTSDETSGIISDTPTQWLLAAVIAYAVVRDLFQAATRPFWYDELCTWIIVKQGSVSAVWRALSHAVDSQPPPYYLIERLASLLTNNEHISFRIPSILGFSCVTFCLYSFVRKKSGGAVALACAMIPLFTVLFDPYSVEARPYCLMVACISIALVCYQHAPSIRWMILMGATFAVGESFHYYSVISVIPFVVTETVFALSARRIRWSVWLAFSCVLPPLIFFWPLLSGFKNYYGAHIWGLPTLETAEGSYGWYFNKPPTWGLILLVVVLIAVIGTLLVRRQKESARPSTDFPYEPVLIIGFLSLPLIGFLIAKSAHGIMTPRYVIPTVIGFSLAAGYVLPRTKRNSVALLAILILFSAFAVQEKRFWSSHNPHFISPAESVQALVTSAGYPDLPVVVSVSHDYLQLAHYASPEWKDRFVSVVDPPEAVLYTGSDLDDKNLQTMRNFAPLHVYDFDKFAADHASFLLYSSNAGLGADWWGVKLFRNGYSFKMLAQTDFYHRVFLVTKKDAAH
jgi:hypothetical protein